MAACPRCGHSVPSKAIWHGAGLAGIVCPQCNASLEPTRLSNAIVLMIALAAGNGVGYYLRLRNVGTAGELLGLLGTMFVVWVLLLGIFIRLQIKQSSLTPWRR